MRIDFSQFRGETITLMRYDPLCEKIMVAKGTVLGGFGYTTTGCSEGVYFEVADSNKILALITSVCLFMLFKNLNIKQNKVINNVAASTFGVLLIHANSDTMRKFLWYDVFDGTKYYGTAILYVHAILSVIIIFAICILIDILRRMTLEKVFLEKIDKIKFSK